MQDGVPKIPLRAGAVVGQLVRLLETGKIQPQTGHGGVGLGTRGKEAGGLAGFEEAVRFAAGTHRARRRSAGKRHQPVPVSVEGEHTSHLGSILGWIELHETGYPLIVMRGRQVFVPDSAEGRADPVRALVLSGGGLFGAWQAGAWAA